MKKQVTVDQFLSALKSQIELTCRIHNCKFEDIPEPLWNLTLGAAMLESNLDFSKMGDPRYGKFASPV